MSGVSSKNRFAALAMLPSSQPPSPSTSRPPSPKDTAPPLSPDPSLAERLKELSVSDECFYDAGRGFQCPDVSITAPTPSSSPTNSPDWRAKSDDSSDSSPYKNFTRTSSPTPRRRRTPVNPAALPGQSHPLNPTSTPRHPSLPTLPPGVDLASYNNQGCL